MQAEPRVSVIVPTFQRPESLRRTLEGLAAQTGDVPFEVLVVENGSAVAQPCVARFPDFRFFHLPGRGVCAARNLGARHARGAILVFLDNDMVPDPQLVAAHDQAHAGSLKRVVVGGMEFSTETRAYSAARCVADRANSWARALEAADDGRCAAADLSTGNFSIRRAFLAEVGGFDESLDPFGPEELDLALRLERAGAEFWFEPRASAHHFAADAEVDFYDQVRLSAAPYIALAAKHGLSEPHIARTLPVKGYTTWRGIVLRVACRHAPRLTAAIGEAISLAARKTPVARRPLSALDYRMKLHQAFWRGVTEAVGWQRADEVLRPRGRR